MPRDILQNLINHFSIEEAELFFRRKSDQFNPSARGVYADLTSDRFHNPQKLGEIVFDGGGEKLIVVAAEARDPLTERSGKKAQYEIGKIILKDRENADAGIFIFYDGEGAFRFSLIYPQPIGNRRVWNNFRRFTYFVNKDLANKTFLQQIGGADFGTLGKVKEAFSLSKVTSDFYKDFYPHFDRLAHSVKNRIEQIIPFEKKQDFVLLCVIRIIFLGFIQKRGWLGNDQKFLQNFLQEYASKNLQADTFYSRWLEPLFFEALNSPPGAKVAYRANDFSEKTEKALQMAPFLNGGLFERKDLDKSGYYIPDKEIKLFFDFLFSYNFTIEENALYDEDLELSPEFLGIIFERLVNKENGAIYTPRVAVDFMCRLALVKWLEKNNITEIETRDLYELFFIESGEGAAYQDRQKHGSFSKQQYQDILNLLENITICDPAVGSGAFPVGILHIIDEIESHIESAIGGNSVSRFDRKKRIIERSLYGVEVKPWAVWITQLRLWITLFIDAPEEMKQSLQPILPSLDFKIRSGDSLAQIAGGKQFPVEGHAFISPSIKRKITTLKNIKADYFYNKKGALKIKMIEKKEVEIYRDILDEEIKIKQAELAAEKGKQPKENYALFGDIYAAKRQEQFSFNEQAIKKLDDEIAALREQSQKLKQDKPLVWNIEFAEIFAERGGFDIVIGNPPYVRQENIADPSHRMDNKAYRTRLFEMVQLDYPDYFTKDKRISAKSDLYAYFYLRALKLLNGKGLLTFICSNSWLDVGYGAWLQEFLLNRAPVEFIIDNHAKRTFEAADVNTIITVIHAPRKKVEPQAVIKFVAFKKPFEEALFTENLLAIEQAREICATDVFRVYPITAQELYDAGSEYEKKYEGKSGEAHKILKKNKGNYVGGKWGGKFLRAPDIYFTILEKGAGKLVRLGDIAEVRFGIKTGANEFFYLEDVTEAVEEG